MKSFIRVYQTTLNSSRLFLGDVLILIELWEKIQPVFTGGGPL